MCHSPSPHARSLPGHVYSRRRRTPPRTAAQSAPHTQPPPPRGAPHPAPKHHAHPHHKTPHPTPRSRCSQPRRSLRPAVAALAQTPALHPAPRTSEPQAPPAPPSRRHRRRRRRRRRESPGRRPAVTGRRPCRKRHALAAASCKRRAHSPTSAAASARENPTRGPEPCSSTAAELQQAAQHNSTRAGTLQQHSQWEGRGEVGGRGRACAL